MFFVDTFTRTRKNPREMILYLAIHGQYAVGNVVPCI